MRHTPILSLLAATAAGALTFAVPAAANSQIGINPGNVPTTAAAHSDHECSPAQGGGPYAGQDVWVFNLPGAAAGDFVSVTATFSTPGGTVTKTIPTDGGAIVRIGTSKAWIALPAGWTLTGASAVITGTAAQFVLTHTCPASGSASPSPSPSPSTSATPTASASAGPSATATPPANPPSSDPSGTPGDPSGSATPVPPGSLPRTGTAIISLVSAGAAITAAGVALLWFLRRRRTLATIPD